MPSVRSFYLARMTLLAALWGGCSSSGAKSRDAATDPKEHTLTVLTPPGESVGLAFGESTTLRVRYAGPFDAPVANAAVAFAIPTSNDPKLDPRGSSLGRAVATTDALGVAQVTLVAGSEATEFRVVASAPQALDVSFFVTVSDTGFASLEPTPTYVGARPASAFPSVEVRLYSGAACQELDPAALPESAYPAYSASQFGQVERYRALAAKSGYTVVAWGEGTSGRILAAGCVELLPAQVRPGATLRFAVPVTDRPLSLADSYVLHTAFDLTAVRDALLGPGSPWRRLACPYGPVEVLLDCAIDALDSGDPEDCVVEKPGADAEALLALFDRPNPDGCQPTFGTAEKLMRTLFAPDMNAARTLPPLVPRLLELFSGLSMESRLDTNLPLAVHSLHSATLMADGKSFATSLLDSSRPLVIAEGVGLKLDGASLELLPHGFTLRLGDFLLPLFQSEYLDVLGVSADTLGTALIESARIDAPERIGCATLASVCLDAGLPETCLSTACPAGVSALNQRLRAVFTDLEAPWIDLALHGQALLLDQDEDLVFESLAKGEWTAQLGPAAGKIIDLRGTFTGSLP